MPAGLLEPAGAFSGREKGEMEREKILACVDHTLLKQDAVWEDMKGICDDAVKYRTASRLYPAVFCEGGQEIF